MNILAKNREIIRGLTRCEHSRKHMLEEEEVLFTLNLDTIPIAEFNLNFGTLVQSQYQPTPRTPIAVQELPAKDSLHNEPITNLSIKSDKKIEKLHLGSELEPRCIKINSNTPLDLKKIYLIVHQVQGRVHMDTLKI